jgi:hypothetical protein
MITDSHGKRPACFTNTTSSEFIGDKILSPVNSEERIDEIKALRKIYGLFCENGEWRIRTNAELMEFYDELDIVTEVKRMRLRWLGHMERMSDGRSTKKLYSNKPEGLRLVASRGSVG